MESDEEAASHSPAEALPDSKKRKKQGGKGKSKAKSKGTPKKKVKTGGTDAGAGGAGSCEKVVDKAVEGSKGKAQRKCKLCKQPGHYRSTCSLNPDAVRCHLAPVCPVERCCCGGGLWSLPSLSLYCRVSPPVNRLPSFRGRRRRKGRQGGGERPRLRLPWA